MGKFCLLFESFSRISLWNPILNSVILILFRKIWAFSTEKSVASLSDNLCIGHNSGWFSLTLWSSDETCCEHTEAENACDVIPKRSNNTKAIQLNEYKKIRNMNKDSF